MATKRYDLHIEDDRDATENPLILMKFPAMKSQLDNEPNYLKLSLKPNSFKMNLQVDLNSKAANYNLDKAEYLAGKSIPSTFPNHIVDRNFFSSYKHEQQNEQLYIAQLVNDRIICRPVTHTITMRSDLRHFDVKEEVEFKEEVKPVSIKFAAPERPNQAKKSVVKDEPDDIPDDEKFLSYRPPDSFQANSSRSFLFGESVTKVKPDPDAEPVDVKPQFFHPDIKPKIEKMDIDDIYQYQEQCIDDPNPQIGPDGNNSNAIENAAPSRQTIVKRLVKECLMKAKIANFEEIHKYINDKKGFKIDTISNKDVLDGLTDNGILVQGVWAIKSEVLYADQQKDCTPVTGISIKLYIAARDYLLYLFTKNRFVSRVDYVKRVRIPDYDSTQLFNELAVLDRETRIWELLLPTDERFIAQFPDVVQRQNTFWKVRRANKLAMFSDGDHVT